MEMDTASAPSYEEMLKLNAEDFKRWILLRSELPYRDKLIQEMMEHEEATRSFAKTAKNPDEGGEAAALSVFDREKSEGAVKWLDKLGELSGSGKDYVRDVIFAKATSDHIHLGTHIEVRKFMENNHLVDEIKIYKDHELLELAASYGALLSEETRLFLNKQKEDENGRTMADIAKEMIEVYGKTNEHLKTKYPDNDVAKAWAATNELSAQLLREAWL